MRLEQFVWDSANIRHIARHRVNPDEVEEVFTENHVVLRTRAGRYLVLGRSCFGRYLCVVCEYQKGTKTVRVITARDMDRKERIYFRKRIG